MNGDQGVDVCSQSSRPCPARRGAAQSARGRRCAPRWARRARLRGVARGARGLRAGARRGRGRCGARGPGLGDVVARRHRRVLRAPRARLQGVPQRRRRLRRGARGARDRRRPPGVPRRAGDRERLVPAGAIAARGLRAVGGARLAAGLRGPRGDPAARHGGGAAPGRRGPRARSPPRRGQPGDVRAGQRGARPRDRGRPRGGDAPPGRGDGCGPGRRVRGPAARGLDLLLPDPRVRGGVRLRARRAVVPRGRQLQPAHAHRLRQRHLPRVVRLRARVARPLGGGRAGAARGPREPHRDPAVLARRGARPPRPAAPPAGSTGRGTGAVRRGRVALARAAGPRRARPRRRRCRRGA